MNKRIVCFLLAMILVLGLVPNAAITANAASKLTTSTNAVKVLTEVQTFKQYQYESGGKYYIGYGSEIKKGSYPNGISKELALELVRDKVSDEVDAAINAFTKETNVDLQQWQHDALALYSYREGTAWLSQKSPEHALRKAVRTGVTGNAFINTIANSGAFDITDAEGLEAHMNQRLSEANMYLNNGYGYNAPGSMAYSVLDKNGTEAVEAGSDELVAYSTSAGYALNPLNDTTFLGWYVFDGTDDDKINGAPITKLDGSTDEKVIVAKFGNNNTNIYAKYTINTSSLISRYIFGNTYSKADIEKYKGNMEEKAIDTLKSNKNFNVTLEAMVDGVKWVYGQGVGYKNKNVKGWVYMGELPSAGTAGATPIATATVLAENLNIREGATAGSDDIGDLKKGVTVKIYEIKVEKTETGNQSWGKIINTEDANGNVVTGWINLAYTDVLETSGGGDTAVGETGKIINTDVVNVRKTPEVVAGNVITQLKQGTKVTVLETKMNGANQWGRVQWSGLSDGYTEGWVYMYYVEMDDAPHSNPGNTPGAVLYTGVVTSNINLNVRNNADVYAKKVGSLANGTKVNIYEVKSSRSMKWGRIGDGQWVCLTYVALTKVENSGGTGTTTTTDTVATVTAATLDILKNYNSNAQKVGSLKKGDVVTILEKNTEKTETGSRIWGRIAKDGVEGWINLAYVELKTVASVTTPGTGSTGSTGSTNSNGAAAVISDCISVNVREAAGTRNAQITKLNNGTAVKVYEQVTKDNAPWARITWDNGSKEGWVCMYYVTMSQSSTGISGGNGSTVSGTNSNTISVTGYVNSNIDLNVRAGAGLGYGQIGSLKKGTKVTIYEQVVADGMIWGRMNYANGSGWVCMSYITVESASNTGKGVMGTIARCFAAVNVRSAPGTNNALVGTISVGTRVEVFETKQHGTMLWGRVAQGWICMNYVLLDSELPPGTILDATEPTTVPTTAPSANEETINRDGEIAFIIEAEILQELNVRNDTSVNSDRVGTINPGMLVDIKAVKNNGAELWGRIDQYATAGWILMDKANVRYAFTVYVNTDEQPIYQDPTTSSTVKGTLGINKDLVINKITTDGDNVYGWVEQGIYGWIPMSRVSEKPVDVIRTYKADEHVGNGSMIHGKTFAAMEAYDSIGGSRVVFKMTSGVNVHVSTVKFENGKVWGYIEYDVAGSDSGEYGYGWIDMSKINYSLQGTVTTTELNVRNTMDANSTTNIITVLPQATNVEICQLSFDAYGNVWARLNGHDSIADPDADTNGAFIMIMTASKTVYVQTVVTP